MAHRADSESTEDRPAFPPPRPPTPPTNTHIASLCAVDLQRAMSRELTPKDVLSDLFEELLVANPEELAAIVLQRLIDAGFEIVPAEY